ncbi:MAG TPA: hypothetical protein VIP98_22675 [Microlunatus sp.]
MSTAPAFSKDSDATSGLRQTLKNLDKSVSGVGRTKAAPNSTPSDRKAPVAPRTRADAGTSTSRKKPIRTTAETGASNGLSVGVGVGKDGVRVKLGAESGHRNRAADGIWVNVELRRYHDRHAGRPAADVDATVGRTEAEASAGLGHQHAGRHARQAPEASREASANVDLGVGDRDRSTNASAQVKASGSHRQRTTGKPRHFVAIDAKVGDSKESVPERHPVDGSTDAIGRLATDAVGGIGHDLGDREDQGRPAGAVPKLIMEVTGSRSNAEPRGVVPDLLDTGRARPHTPVQDHGVGRIAIGVSDSGGDPSRAVGDLVDGLASRTGDTVGHASDQLDHTGRAVREHGPTRDIVGSVTGAEHQPGLVPVLVDGRTGGGAGHVVADAVGTVPTAARKIADGVSDDVDPAELPLPAGFADGVIAGITGQSGLVTGTVDCAAGSADDLIIGLPERVRGATGVVPESRGDVAAVGTTVGDLVGRHGIIDDTTDRAGRPDSGGVDLPVLPATDDLLGSVPDLVDARPDTVGTLTEPAIDLIDRVLNADGLPDFVGTATMPVTVGLGAVSPALEADVLVAVIVGCPGTPGTPSETRPSLPDLTGTFDDVTGDLPGAPDLLGVIDDVTGTHPSVPDLGDVTGNLPSVTDLTGNVPGAPDLGDSTGNLPNLPDLTGVINDATGTLPGVPDLGDVTGNLPNLPDLTGVIDDATGTLPGVPDLGDVTGNLPGVPDLAGGINDAAGALPGVLDLGDVSGNLPSVPDPDGVIDGVTGNLPDVPDLAEVTSSLPSLPDLTGVIDDATGTLPGVPDLGDVTGNQPGVPDLAGVIEDASDNVSDTPDLAGVVDDVTGDLPGPTDLGNVTGNQPGFTDLTDVITDETGNLPGPTDLGNVTGNQPGLPDLGNAVDGATGDLPTVPEVAQPITDVTSSLPPIPDVNDAVGDLTEEAPLQGVSDVVLGAVDDLTGTSDDTGSSSDDPGPDNNGNTGSDTNGSDNGTGDGTSTDSPGTEEASDSETGSTTDPGSTATTNDGSSSDQGTPADQSGRDDSGMITSTGAFGTNGDQRGTDHGPIFTAAFGSEGFGTGAQPALNGAPSLTGGTTGAQGLTYQNSPMYGQPSGGLPQQPTNGPLAATGSPAGLALSAAFGFLLLTSGGVLLLARRA